MSPALDEIRATLRDEGGLIAAALAAGGRDPDSGSEPIGARVAAVRGPDYAFVVEAINEGHLLHDGRSRLLDQSDPDLALLAGDRLYALGLERLAALGDLAAVEVLAETISRCATARAEGRPELAAAAWNDAVRHLTDVVAP